MSQHLEDVDFVHRRLAWAEAQEIWPNGLRYLWTDAFGLVLYLSLYKKTGDRKYLTQARQLVDDVYRVLGRQRGLRIGEEEDRDGQYYHYLAMWLFALYRLGQFDTAYHDEAVDLARTIHDAFVVPGRGVLWKMQEDLSGPYPNYGLGAMDAYNGYVIYRLLGEDYLGRQIGEMSDLIEANYQQLWIDQDLGLGMMLWLAHTAPHDDWAIVQRSRSLEQLARLWIQPPGYFCRQEGWHEMKFAFTNYGISLGLQSVGCWPACVNAINNFFDTFESGDEYDTSAITHVMACTSHFPGLFLVSEPTAADSSVDEYSEQSH